MDSSSDTDVDPNGPSSAQPYISAERLFSGGSPRDHFSNLSSDRNVSRLTIQTDLFGRVDSISDNEEDVVLSRWVKTDSVDANIVERIKTKLTGEPANHHLGTLKDVCTRSYDKYQKEDRKTDNGDGITRATAREIDMYAPLVSI
jgi:hypothetical protein